MRKNEVSTTTGSRQVRLAGLSVLLALLLLVAGGITPAAQDNPPPKFQETEEGSSIEAATAPVAEDETDAVLSTKLEAKILEQNVLPNAIQTLIEIPIGQDTYIASNKPNQNFGGASELRVGWDGTASADGALRAFLYFDVARYIPSQAVIRTAHLKGYQVRVEDNTAMLFRGRHLLDSWDEMLITWNSHVPNWGSVTGETWIPTTVGWIEHDLTPLVVEWHHGTHPNYGLFVQGDESPSLGRQRFFYSLNAQNGLYPRLIVDYTVSTDTTPPVATVNALPAWSPTSFTVSWSGTDTGGSGLAYFDVQYSANGGVWTNWQMHTTTSSALFEGGHNGVHYAFRARGVDNAGNVQPWTAAQAQTTVDTIPPTASVQSLPENTYTQTFLVYWSGTDNAGGSGLVSYDVEYRVNHGPWLVWLSRTTQSSAQFTGGTHDALYEFRARARDLAGNVQTFDLVPQAWTYTRINPPTTRVRVFNPPVTSGDSFVVSWDIVEVEPGLTIQHYDLLWRFNDEPWQQWLTGTTLTTATFSSLRAQDGLYSFEVRALDSAGRLETFKGVPEATIAVDRYAPFITAQIWLPIVRK